MILLELRTRGSDHHPSATGSLLNYTRHRVVQAGDRIAPVTSIWPRNAGRLVRTLLASILYIFRTVTTHLAADSDRKHRAHWVAHGSAAVMDVGVCGAASIRAQVHCTDRPFAVT
mgnify:CR=1 FL=1